jgi:hypothetical protein
MRVIVNHSQPMERKHAILLSWKKIGASALDLEPAEAKKWMSKPNYFSVY